MDYQFQYRKNAEALYDALGADAFYNAMENAVSQGQDGKEAMLRYLDYSMVESAQNGGLFIPDGAEYGASVWSIPVDAAVARQKSMAKQQFLLDHMGQKSLATYNSICAFMSEQSSKLFDEDIWYLSILGISPKRQGQGLGPGLVTPVLDKADELGVATFLETFTPRNMSFYKRLGYEAVKSFIEPTTSAEYWVMVRKP